MSPGVHPCKPHLAICLSVTVLEAAGEHVSAFRDMLDGQGWHMA